MSNNISANNGNAQINDTVVIDRSYAERSIAALYDAGKGGTHDGLTVTSRQTRKGNVYVSVERPNGEKWNLSQTWDRHTMRFSYAAECVSTASDYLAEEIIEERTVGGVDFVLRRVVDVFFIEENIMGDSYCSEPPYTSLTEARFAFEVVTGQQVAMTQDYGGDYGDGDPIGYSESTQPYLY